jgi:hypothetical protein
MIFRGAAMPDEHLQIYSNGKPKGKERTAITKLPPRLKHRYATKRKPVLLGPDAEETWLRLRNETGKAYQAFELYRSMEPEVRNLSRVARALKKSVPVINVWSQAWAWEERATAWDRYQARKNLEAAAEAEAKEVAAMKRRHIRQALRMQEKSLLGLQALDPTTMNAHHIARLMRDAVWIERVSRNVPGEVTATTVQGEVDVHHTGGIVHGHLDLSKLSNDKLNQLQSLLEEATSAEPGANQDDEEDDN